MHVGGVMIFEGPPPGARGHARADRVAPPPVPRYGRSSPSRASRWAGRCGSTTRRSTSIPRAPHRACLARRPEQLRLLPRGSSPSGSTARSRCGRSGSSRASRTTASRSSTRPTTRSSTASRASIWRRCCSTCRPVPPERGADAGVDARPGAVAGAAGRRGPEGAPRAARRLAGSAPPARRRTPSGQSSALREAAEGLGEVAWAGINPAPETPLNVADRLAPAGLLGRRPSSTLQGDQELARRNRQRCRAGGRDRRARALAAHARGAHRGTGAARAGAGLDPLRRRARPPRQPHRGHARAAAGLRARPGRAAAHRARVDAGPQGVQAGARPRRSSPGLEDFAPPTILSMASRTHWSHAALQHDRHQRARARSSRSTCRGASCSSSCRSRSCRRTTR